LRAKLPPGFRIELGGSTEESAKGENSIKAVVPLMIVGVITLLMIQLQSISRTFMVLLTAPLGLIGVTLALLVFQVPYGFVANLGVIALMGMILRNSVILVDQIEQDEQAGKSAWEAIVGSTVRRFRPIVLTAGGGGAGHDSADPPGVLGADGGGHHGRPDRRHGADLPVPAGPLRGVVPGARAGRLPGGSVESAFADCLILELC
jgi:energy-converting hydrogenase Eha subunit E